MKKLYKLNILAIVFCLLPTISSATERMIDRSLSVEQTLREPSIRNAPAAGDTGFAPTVPIDPNTAKQLQDLRAQSKADTQKDSSDDNLDFGDLPAPTRKFGATQNYMRQFCAYTSSCQASQKQQACERFKNSTIDVQQLLDRAIDCEINATKAIEGDCDGLDAGRLDLLKQYWQDEEMSYTILFLPDMVLNVSAACGKKGADR